MTITSTQTDHQVRNVAAGRYIDTGTVSENAPFNITTGFKPRYVKIQGLAATSPTLEWYEGMADASAVKRVTAGDFTLITTLGITPLENGFTVGFDLDLVVTSEQLSWIAIG